VAEPESAAAVTVVFGSAVVLESWVLAVMSVLVVPAR
jgi:hypothetical protein